jgi:hypothetical protein
MLPSISVAGKERQNRVVFAGFLPPHFGPVRLIPAQRWATIWG